MYKVQRNEKKVDELSKSHPLEKIVKISVIIGILIVSGFIIYYILTPEPGFVIFGLLNSEKRAENYPIEANVGENISFYVSVQNYLNRDFTFKVEILTGDNNTILSPTEPAKNATSYYNSSQFTLKHSEGWISNMLNVSFSLPGANQRIIVELWEISDIEKYFDFLFLWLNITT
ncbi:MAG: DUF1616 domain-containing protein [Candidatus Hodarchaeota archaeon]